MGSDKPRRSIGWSLKDKPPWRQPEAQRGGKGGPLRSWPFSLPLSALQPGGNKWSHKCGDQFRGDPDRAQPVRIFSHFSLNLSLSLYLALLVPKHKLFCLLGVPFCPQPGATLFPALCLVQEGKFWSQVQCLPSFPISSFTPSSEKPHQAPTQKSSCPPWLQPGN